jgi:CheY-like chemotaxis protein
VPYTLLLADDSTTIQRVIELIFANEDIKVVTFSDGEHAVASLDRTPPDIVLADVGMPGRNGYEMARHIKHSPALAHIPVLLLTGAFEPVDPARAADAGCDGVLMKPFEPEALVKRVKELLAKPRPGTKAAEVESYFEQLDQAFATLAAVEPGPGAQAELPQSESVETSDAPPVPRAPLADAFAALLAAERSGSSPAPRSAAPAPTLASQTVSSDELIERVARRVLERLSDVVVRETVTEIVHVTAERLVREEIERIKINIK